jgi:phosphatidylserine/phosphatidylglycerophosphate/cardiolipin synthase-like enzyme
LKTRVFACRLRSFAFVACLLGLGGFLTLPPAAQAGAPPRLEAAFSPGNAGEALVLKAIASARHSIFMAAYAFTSKPIAQALANAKKRGVTVQVVVDAGEAGERYSSVPWLAARGIPVRIDHKHAIQHNKYFVVDNATIETGSYNYTSSAKQRNAENVLVIWHAPPDIAAAYARDFKKHWGHSLPYRRKQPR